MAFNARSGCSCHIAPPRFPLACRLPRADEEIAAALEVQRLSADEPIAMLSQDPERFFGRTTKVSKQAGGADESSRCVARTLHAQETADN